jgi:hypothetical protein
MSSACDTLTPAKTPAGDIVYSMYASELRPGGLKNAVTSFEGNESKVANSGQPATAIYNRLKFR